MTALKEVWKNLFYRKHKDNKCESKYRIAAKKIKCPRCNEEFYLGFAEEVRDYVRLERRIICPKCQGVITLDLPEACYLNREEPLSTPSRNGSQCGKEKTGNRGKAKKKSKRRHKKSTRTRKTRS